MGRHIRIEAGDVAAEAELVDSPCADALYNALPLQGTANTWGEEVYVAIDLNHDLAEDARANVAVGEIAYWPPGRAFCIFFGATPASGPDGAPRAASEVNPLGRVVGDAAAFRAVRSGQDVVLSRA
jgi:hypothetical protein